MVFIYGLLEKIIKSKKLKYISNFKTHSKLCAMTKLGGKTKVFSVFKNQCMQ